MEKNVQTWAPWEHLPATGRMKSYQIVFSFFLLSEALSIVDKRIINEKVKSDNHEGTDHIGVFKGCWKSKNTILCFVFSILVMFIASRNYAIFGLWSSQISFVSEARQFLKIHLNNIMAISLQYLWKYSNPESVGHYYFLLLT